MAMSLQRLIEACRRENECGPLPLSVPEPSQMPQVVETQSKGHILMATADLKAGDTCLLDEPLIEYPNITGRDDLSWLATWEHFDQDDLAFLGYAFMQFSPDDINMLVTGMHFSKQTEQVQADVLSIFCPPHDDLSVKATVDLAAVFHERFEDLLNIPLPVYIKVLLIKKVNGFEHRARRSVILYGTGCRLSHSCRPNCFRTVLPDGNLLVRTVAPVLAGTELTISYLQPEKMFGCAADRALYLKEGYLFDCDCPRCTSPEDDTRGVACTHCGEADVQLTLNNDRGSPSCAACGNALTSHQIKDTCHQERILAQELKRLEKGTSYLPSIGPIVALINDCHEAGLRYHHILYSAHDIEYFCALSLHDFNAAAEAALRQISYLLHVYDAYPLPLAWKYEALGDALAGKVSLEKLSAAVPEGQQTSRDADIDTIITRDDVAAVYMYSYRMMLRCYGPHHHFTQEIREKVDRLS